MGDFKTDSVWIQNDGRRAKRLVKEQEIAPGQVERVTELHVEEERPMHLAERVIEKKKPFVYERVVETVDKDGNVVEQKTESIDPVKQMVFRDHVTSAQFAPAPKYDNHVTKEEMIETIVAAFKSIAPEPTVRKANVRSIAKNIGADVQEGGMDRTTWVLCALAVAAAGALTYVTFIMPTMM